MFFGNLAGVYGPDIAGEATNLTTISEIEFSNLTSNSSKNNTRRRVLGEVNSFNGFRLAARDPYGQLVRSENKALVVVRLKDLDANDSARLVAPE